jgi:hypothetical protein
MKAFRWIAVIPAGIVVALLIQFPIHWTIMLASSSEESLITGWSTRTVEELVVAFATPLCVIYFGSWVAPKRRIETSIALAIIIAIILGGVYVLAFTGGPQFSGWGSLHYGFTPLLNLAGIAVALFLVKYRWDTSTINARRVKDIETHRNKIKKELGVSLPDNYPTGEELYSLYGQHKQAYADGKISNIIGTTGEFAQKLKKYFGID